jgi:hypothetical protein
MKTILRIAILAFGLVVAATAFARGDIRDDRAWVKPEKGDRFSINGYTMGKVELYGYLGQLRDDEHIKGVVLRHGASDAQKQAIVSSAKTLQIEAFEDDGGLKPLTAPDAVAPTPPAPTPPPASATTPAPATTTPTGS